MSAAATAAGYLYASGRLGGKRRKEAEARELALRHGPTVAKALMERKQPVITYKRRLP